MGLILTNNAGGNGRVRLTNSLGTNGRVRIWLSQPSSNDPDAQAFITAAGITDPTQQSAINTLVLDLKSNNIWTKMDAIYPMVGGTATTHKFNLKNPADTDAAFRLSFIGGWTHSANGALPNGTNAYANTFLNTSTNLSLNSHSFGIYSRTNDVSGTKLYGAFNNSNLILHNNLSGGNFISGFTTNIVSYTANPSTSLLMASRTSTTSLAAYRGGVLLGTNTNLITLLPNTNFYFGARSKLGVAEFFSTHQLAFGFLGSGLNSTEASSLYTNVQAFQTTLGRQV
jgi:hypothetical protein